MVLPADAKAVRMGASRGRPERLWRTGGRIGPRAGVATGALIFLAASAQAQVTPTPPTREEVERPAPAREVPRAQLSVEGGIERAPCSLDQPQYRDIRVTVREVVFDDLRGVSAEALRAAYAPYVGQENSIAVVCEIRDRAAAMINQAGYLAAVEVPEQRIENGVVHFRVVMARLVALRVRGDAGHAEQRIAGYLDRLTHEMVFNRYDAERYLLLAGDLPGYSVRLSLRPAGTARGEVVGEVTVLYTPASADVTVQNLGSHALGPYGVLARAELYGLTGLGDRTTLAVYSTADFDEQQTVQLAHEFRLGDEGLTFAGQATYAWAHPDLGDPLVDIRSRTLFATLEARYPFVRRQRETLWGTLGLDYVDQDVDFNDIPFSRDRLRVAFARLDFDATARDRPGYTPAEPRWRIAGSAEFRQGVDLFGASDGCGPLLAACLVPGIVPPARQEGDPTSTLARGGLQAEIRPVPRFTIAAAARGQYSGHPLFSFEEFAAGNYTIGRGYDPGTLLGDSGIGVQAELRYGSLYPVSADSLAVQAFAFIDQAWVWNKDQFPAIPRQELTSVGGGVRAAFGGRFRLEILLAAPLDRTTAQPNRDVRLLFTLTTRLWPWS